MAGGRLQERGGSDSRAGRQLTIAGRGKKITWQRVNVMYLFSVLTTLVVLFKLKNREGVSHTWQIGGGVIGWIGQVRDFRNYSLFSYLAASHNLVPLSCSTFALLQTGGTTGDFR